MSITLLIPYGPESPEEVGVASKLDWLASERGSSNLELCDRF